MPKLMLRKSVIALSFAILSAPALAANATTPAETVTVYGNSLAGIWHGSLYEYSYSSGFFSAPKAQGVAAGFCRIAPRKNDLQISCLQDGGPPATVNTDGNHVRFAGGSMFFAGGFDGELVGAGQLHGRFWIRRLGIAYQNPALSDAARVTPDPAAPDKAGKAKLLRQILDDGLAGVPQDPDAMKKNGSNFGSLPENFSQPELGAVQAIAYLGQETKLDFPPPGTKLDFDHLRLDDIPRRPDFFSVYLVNFADGERLCGLHQRNDGVLDAFRCI